MRYRSTKTYGHEVGLSACFRQWRAESHCSRLHGYALSVRLEFGADTLDKNNWVVDFGALKPVKEWLAATFDHKTLVAYDDPFEAHFRRLDRDEIADVLFVEATGCEAFAEMIADWVKVWLSDTQGERVRLISVEVREHGANSAIFFPGG